MLQVHQISNARDSIVVGNRFEIAGVRTLVTLFRFPRHGKPELGKLPVHMVPPARGAEHDVRFRITNELLKSRSTIAAKILVYRHRMT